MRHVTAIMLLLLITGCAGSRLPAPRGATESIGTRAQSEAFFQSALREFAAQQLEAADKLFGERQYDDARAKYEEAVKEAADVPDNSLLAEAYAQIARTYGIEGKFEDGRPWLARAKAVASPDEPMGWSRYLGVRGRFEWQDEKDNEKAKRTFIEMYEYCKQAELFSRELDAAHMVAIVGTPDEKVEWSLNAIAAAEKGGEKNWLGPLWNNLGWTYEERGEYDKMLEALLNARKYHYEAGNEHTQLVADFGVARAYWRNADLTESRKCLDDARNRALQRHEADPEDTEKGEWVGWGHVYLGDLLVSEDKPAEALQHFKLGRPYLIKSGIENWWPEGLKELDDKIAKLENTGGE